MSTDIYMENEGDGIIEVISISRKEGDGAVAFSTLYQKVVGKVTSMSGQFGWMTKAQLKQGYTKVGVL